MVIGPFKIINFGFLTFTTKKSVDSDYLLFLFYQVKFSHFSGKLSRINFQIRKKTADLSLYWLLINFIRGNL